MFEEVEPKTALPTLPHNDILLENEVWYEKFNDDVPGVIWGLVKNTLKNEICLLIIMLDSSIIPMGFKYTMLKDDRLEWGFKKVESGTKTHSVSVVKMGDQSFDVVFRVPITNIH